MVKLKLYLVLLGIGLATAVNAAAIAKAPEKDDQAAHTSSSTDATTDGAVQNEPPLDGGILAHFHSKEELEPFTAAQAESQMKAYFSAYGHCDADSDTCHQHICSLDSPKCTTYTAEEKKELVEQTQQMLLKLISTGKCTPTPNNAKFCNHHGYCDLFESKGACKELDPMEYADVISLLRPSSNGSFDFVNDHHSTSRFEKRSDKPITENDLINVILSASDDLLERNFFAYYGSCDQESETCSQQTCKLGTPKCTPFTREEKDAINHHYQKILVEVVTTGKCTPTPDNAAYCSKEGYCSLFDQNGEQVEQDKCKRLNNEESQALFQELQTLPDGDEEDSSTEAVKDSGEKTNGAGAADGKSDSSKDSKKKEGDDSDAAVAKSSFQKKEDGEYKAGHTGTDDATAAGEKVKRAPHIPINMGDQGGELGDNPDLTPHPQDPNHPPTDSSIKVKRDLSSNPSPDEKFVTFYPSSSDSISQYARPSKHETYEFMDLAGEIAEDDLIAETIALAAGIHDVPGLDRFYDRLDAISTRKHVAVQALERAKEAQMLSESKGTERIPDAQNNDEQELFEKEAEPTKAEVDNLMAICKKLTTDDVKLQAVAMAAGVQGSAELYRFRVRVREMGRQERAARKALRRVRSLQFMMEEMGADEPRFAFADGVDKSNVAVKKAQPPSDAEAASKSG